LQFDNRGYLRHLLTLDDMPAAEIRALMTAAGRFIAAPGAAADFAPLLAGRTMATLFFEPSTRTRCSFELAARRLGATTLDLGSASSTSKGETLADTLNTLEAMNVDILAVRHLEAGLCARLARIAGEGTVIVNAGEGERDHPTQGLLDVLTIARHKPRFDNLAVTFVGDIAHSRVARSTMTALATLGVADIRLAGPAAWLPEAAPFDRATRRGELDACLDGADVAIALRIQKERMGEAALPDFKAYFDRYGLTETRMARAAPDAIVMHPGPMNRGVEIDGALADGPRSVVREQVRNGVAMRMAVMARLIGNVANPAEIEV
jgi:aspartate carbamoyltransferase catalytic subunit